MLRLLFSIGSFYASILLWLQGVHIMLWMLLQILPTIFPPTSQSMKGNRSINNTYWISIESAKYIKKARYIPCPCLKSNHRIRKKLLFLFNMLGFFLGSLFSIIFPSYYLIIWDKSFYIEPRIFAYQLLLFISKFI